MATHRSMDEVTVNRQAREQGQMSGSIEIRAVHRDCHSGIDS